MKENSGIISDENHLPQSIISGITEYVDLTLAEEKHMTIVIDGAGLSVEKLMQIARHGEQVKLASRGIGADKSL